MLDCESKQALRYCLTHPAAVLLPLLILCRRMISPTDVDGPFIANNAMKGPP